MAKIMQPADSNTATTARGRLFNSTYKQFDALYATLQGRLRDLKNAVFSATQLEDVNSASTATRQIFG